MIRPIFAMILLACFFIISCKGVDKEKSNTKGLIEKKTVPRGFNAGTGTFSITAPDGWRKIDTTMMGYQAVFLLSELENKNDLFRENINVVTERVGKMEMDNYIVLTKKNVQRMLTDYKLHNEKNLTVDGVPATSMDYSHKMSGYKIDVNVILLIKNEIAYIITTSAEQGKLEKLRSIIDETLASFKVN